jgi:hypothetical protein
LAFHPYAQLIPQFFNIGGFGPPFRITEISTWPCIDHLASGLIPATMFALFRLAFATDAPEFGLSLLQRINSPDHYSIGTPLVHSSPKRIAFLRQLVSVRFHVLFHSPSGVLFTFPSRYWSTIGHEVVFSLTGWSRQIHTEFHVFRATWVFKQEKVSDLSPTGLSPSTA